MRLNIILMVLLVVLGLGVSLLLVPRDKDVALLKLRSDETDEARQVLLDQYDRGDRSVKVIASLADIAITVGEIPIAVALLEEYVTANPKDVSARRRLAEYYRFDQRRDDYLAMLEDVVDRDGTAEERRLLTDLYRRRGEYEPLLASLNDLIARGEARSADYREAANLAAALGEFDQSMAVTEQFWRIRPASFNADTVKLYVMVAAAAGKEDLAEDVVARLASGEAGPSAIVPVIREVSDRNQATLGLRLLRRFEDDLQNTPALLVAWARMQQSLDQEVVAMERLRGLEEAGELPDLAVPVLIDLALLAGNVDLLVAMMAKRNMAELNDFRLRAIMDLAVFHRSVPLLVQFREQAPEIFVQREPALVAEVFIALNQTEPALEQVRLARAEENRRLDQLLRLARAQIRLGLESEAAETLERIAWSPDLDEAGMRALSQLYVETERTTEGLAAFQRLREERPSLTAESGWARMAAAEGRDGELRAWMNTRAGLGEDLLTDLVYLGSSGRAPRSALEAARRLFQNHPGSDSRRLYGDALVGAGHHNEAIDILRELLPGNDEDAESWITALAGAGRQADALDFLTERAGNDGLPVQLADDLIYLALDLNRADLAYTELRRQPIGRLDADAVAAVMDSAAENGERDLIDDVLRTAGYDFMAARPVLAARIELVRSNRTEAARWADVAASRHDLKTAEKISLAAVYSALDRPEQSLGLLRQLATDPTTPGFALVDLGAQYLALGKEAEGLPVFRELRKSRTEPAVAEAWARLETAAGDSAMVGDWLAEQENPSRQLLTDLYYLAREKPADALALQASERLIAGYPGPVSARIRADVLLANGRAEAALPMIEQLLPGNDETAELYVSALVSSQRPADALDFLLRRAGDQPQSLSLADDLIGLAFGQGKPELAYAEAERQPLRQLDADVLASLAENAANDGRFGLFDRIVAELGPAFLEERPVLAARLALARDNRREAQTWADRAMAADDLANPDIVALAGVFAALDEPAKAVSLLERAALDPDTPAFALSDLAATYLRLGQAKEGLALFRQLRERRVEPPVQEAWARLETAAGNPESVSAWLRSAAAPSAQLLADVHYLAAERKAHDLAFEAGELFYKSFPGPESRRIHATGLIARGRAEDAVPILKQLLPGDNEVAEAYVGALSAVDRKAEALAFLRERADGKALPIRIADDYMALAIELDQSGLAYDHARLHDMSQFDDDTIASIVENAAEDGDMALVDRIVDQTGGSFFAKRPVMAARIELARGNEALAREWAERARGLSGLDNTRTLQLAKVYSDLNEPETSLALLESLARDPETPAFAMADLAGQYLQLGKAKRGLPVLRELLARRDELPVQEGWARLETEAGDPQTVLDWLKGVTSTSRQALIDIYYLASGKDAKALGLEASRQLYERFPGREASLIRGLALNAGDRGAEAVAVLRPLLPGTREVRAAYVAALGQSGNTEDLSAFAGDVLDDRSLDPEVRSALLFALLDAGAGEIALPRLRELARSDPATWEAAYLSALRQAGADEERADVIEAKLTAGPRTAQRDTLLFELLDVAGPGRALPWLKRAATADPAGTWPATYETALADLGRRNELIDWLTLRSRLTGLQPTARREIGFRLLDLNAKRPAEEVFLDLAANASPTGNDVQQLLYLWGPKPPKRGTDWLVGRARTASSADLPGWLKLLSDVRAYGQVINLGSDPVPTSARDPRLNSLVVALLQTGRRSEVAALLDPLIPVTENPDDLLRLADWAEQAVQQRTAIAAYERALTRIGDDAEKLRKAGRAFAFGGRAELAVETLERYFLAPDNRAVEDYRPWYHYALSLAQMNRQPEARSAYREMLDVQQRTGADDFESRRSRAGAYQALGDGERAVGIYEKLLAERPRDRSLKADFVALLIELRRYEQAELLLSQN